MTKQTNSSEVCHISLSGVRKHTSFRCDSELWKVFKEICQKNGLSTCDILEKLIMGFCIGITQPSVAHPTTMNVVVDAPRVVKRVRRRQLVFEDEVSVQSQRFYCALGDEHVPFESLPLAGCHGCPNVSCRRFVFERLDREFGEGVVINE